MRRRNDWLSFDAMRTVELAFLHLGCSPSLVEDLLASPAAYYKPRYVRRRRRARAPRLVFEVQNDVRRVHRTIALSLRPHVDFLPDCVHGYRHGRSILTNARPHCGKPNVVVADLASFFETITTERVVDLFSSLGCRRQVAVLLARICTLEGRVPQGARTSPSIANLVAAKLDASIEAAFQNCTYTRYADDLALSGDDTPTEAALAAVVEQHGFQLREGSYRHQPNVAGQYVTGLNVQAAAPKMPRRVRRRIDRHLFFCCRHSVEEHLKALRGREPDLEELHKFLMHLRGNIVSYGRVEPRTYRKWATEFKGIRLRTNQRMESPE